MTAAGAPASVPAAFAGQVAVRPGAVAVRGAGGQLTYAELDRQANRLAHRLVELGVRPDRPVAVRLPRSVEAVAALLAVVKAGGAYLALDPAHPVARQRALLADARPAALVTSAALPPIDHAVPTVWLDRDRAELDRRPDTAPGATVRTDAAACVMYTSGSTGEPKGVCVPHRAVLRLVRNPDYVCLGPDDAVLNAAPLAFDASTFEIWGALLNGARLVVLDGEVSPARLAEVVRAERVTVLWLTAGLFHQFADGPLTDFGSLRYLLAGGDVLSAPHVRRAATELPRSRLVNGYGPTENTTFTCCHRIPPGFADAQVPIGTPIRGTRVHVLDGALREVATGGAGELYAGGDGLARGYLGLPGRTAERFVADPFGPPGSRLYRTGDRVRRRADGTLDFLGRADRQVKISGFRVEPGEVEATLAGQTGVVDVAVVAQPAPAGGRRLVAFVVPDRSRGVETVALRRRLAETLPAPAVPGAIHLVDALPLTPAGKVDRADLETRTSRVRPQVSAAYRDPDTPVEQVLVRMWSDLLHIDGIGVDDDFFELGGYSLLGTRITGEIAAAYGVTVRPRAFYEHSTVARLAELVEQRLRQAGQERR